MPLFYKNTPPEKRNRAFAAGQATRKVMTDGIVFPFPRQKGLRKRDLKSPGSLNKKEKPHQNGAAFWHPRRDSNARPSA